MKKPAFEGRANSVATKTILAPSCLIVDAAMAHLHLDLLHKDDMTTHLRAFPHKGGSMGARTGLFGQDLDLFSQYNAEGRGIYLVINNGGNSDNSITECVAFFVEWDDLSLDIQELQWKVLNLPEPSFQLKSGGRSIHSYWVLKQPVAPKVWHPIQIRLVDYCKADRNVKNPSRVMRLAGFYYIDKEGNPTTKSQIINVTGKEYSLEDITQVLPKPKAEAPRYKKVITKSDWTIKDVAAALDAIPARVGGTGTYEEYRQLAWGLKAIVKEIGYSESLAIDLMEAHSPSGKATAWNIPQVMRSGGERTGAGTFIFIAQKHGWRPKSK